MRTRTVQVISLVSIILLLALKIYLQNIGFFELKPVQSKQLTGQAAVTELAMEDLAKNARNGN